MKKNRKILVVEDDLAMKAIGSKKLKANSYDVIEASDGKKAVAAISREKPDLVLLDLMLPQLDGFGVLKWIRENKEAKISATPVIILSNLYSNEDIMKAQALKIQGYFVKAYLTTDDILHEIDDVFEKTLRPLAD